MALAFAGLELAAVGGAELPRVLRALRVGHKPDGGGFFYYIQVSLKITVSDKGSG